MKTSDFDYHLPKELIAQSPMEPRDHSRLMVMSRVDGSIEHRHFYDLPQYLNPGDLVVFNDSRVIPARLNGRRRGTGGKVEILLLHRLSPRLWRALVRPGRKMSVGTVVEIAGNNHSMSAEVIEVAENGARTVRLDGEEHLDELGVVPLPPYIHEPLGDLDRYQTVYARVAGSVAAPTAGLHFTATLLERLTSAGVEFAFVTLHVGWDSFRRVSSEDIESHEMHSEYWELDAKSARVINRAKSEGRRVVSVGTTAVRLMENAAALHDGADGRIVSAGSGWADLFIYPGYEFRVVDALVTNFHLPKSTLLMLTSAFAGHELILEAYRVAAEGRYRFYSFGDAMLLQ